MDFTPWLAGCRRTGSEVARQIGVSHTAVAQLRDGTRHPSVDLILRIQQASGGAVVFEDWALRRLLSPRPWKE